MSPRMTMVCLSALMTAQIPVAVVRDSSDRLQISLVTGAARYESKHFGCSGELLSAYPVDVTSTGARVDYWPGNGSVRISGAGGRIGEHSPDRGAEDIAGPYGGIQLAWEGRSVGLGAGFTRISGEDGLSLPSGYLRIGDLNGVHFQADMLPPSESLGITGWCRVGVGFDKGPLAPGYMVGLSFLPFSYSEQVEPRVFGDFHFPVSRRVDILARGQFGPGECRMQWAAGGGLRLNVGALPLDDRR